MRKTELAYFVTLTLTITLEKCIVAKAALSFQVRLYHNAVTH